VLVERRGFRAPLLEVRAYDDPQWLGFLEGQPSATAFHHPAWSQVLAATYGYRPFVVVQTRPDGEVAAGMPLLEVGRPGSGCLVSLPFTDHCPPLTSPAADVAQFTHNLLEWRDGASRPGVVIHDAVPALPGVQPVARGVRHVLPLDQGRERALEGLGKKVRSSIRKAQREEVRVRIGQSLDDLAPFYQLHVETRRRLGVPVQPKRFMENLFRQMVGEGLGFVVFAYKAEHLIAAALFLAWNRHLIYKFAASDPRYSALCPNNLVLWTAIDWGCQHGFRALDLGRTEFDNRGLRDFKSRWGATEVPLVYSYLATALPGSAPRLLTGAVAKLIQWSPPLVCRVIGELLYGRVGLT
jgi:CelD/BcsL family acetyltransferase involved in cellulose biosynthesis